MPTPNEIIELEKKFWQSIVDEEPDVAIEMLCEPSVMVSSKGAMQFDHASFRKMAEDGQQVLTAYELSDMRVVFPNDSTAVLTYHARQEMKPRGKSGGTTQEMNDSSTWIHSDGRWKCAAHTETPAGEPRAGS